MSKTFIFQMPATVCNTNVSDRNNLISHAALYFNNYFPFRPEFNM